MADIESFLVNEKTYKVQLLGVLDSLYFQAELAQTLGSAVGEIVNLAIKAKGKIGDIDIGELGNSISKINPEALKKIQPKILAQVITPENRFLGDQQTIEEWFSKPENTGDVWEVLIKGAIALLGKYLPSFLKGNLQKEKTEATA